MSKSTTSYYESAGKPEASKTGKGISPEDAKLRRAKKTVKDFLEESEKYTKPYFKKFRRIYADYMMSRAAMIFPSDTEQGVQSALSYQIIEAFTPEVVMAFFQEKPYVNILARRQELVQIEKDIEDFLSFEADEMGIVPKFILAAKSVSMFGTHIVKTPWRKETKQFRRPDGSSYPKKIYDMPDWDNVSIFNFFPDPHYKVAGDIDGMKGCVHRVFRTMDQLERNKKRQLVDGTSVGVYTNLDKLKERIAKNESSIPDASYYDQDKFYDQKTSEQTFGATQTNGIQCDEYWGVFDADGDGNLLEYVITLADGEIVIRCDVNGLDGQYKPFLADINSQTPGEWYGVGNIEPVWSILTEAKILKQTKLRAVKLATNPVSIVDRSGGFNLKNLVSYPGALWVGNDTNAIKPLPIGDGFLAAYREIASMELEIQQALALPTPGAAGIPGGAQVGRTTAGINFIQGSVAKRLMLRTMLCSGTLIEPFFYRLIDLNNQFLPDEVPFRVLGTRENPFKIVKKENFKASWYVSAKVAMDRMTKSMRQANLKENIIPLLELNDKANPGSFKWDIFIPEALKDFDYRDTERYFRPEQELQQMKQQQLQQQQQVAAQNTQMQAMAQGALVDKKTQGELQKRQMMDQASLTKTIIKETMDAKLQKDTQQADIAHSLISTVIKGITGGDNGAGNQGQG